MMDAKAFEAGLGACLAILFLIAVVWGMWVFFVHLPFRKEKEEKDPSKCAGQAVPCQECNKCHPFQCRDKHTGACPEAQNSCLPPIIGFVTRK